MPGLLPHVLGLPTEQAGVEGRSLPDVADADVDPRRGAGCVRGDFGHGELLSSGSRGCSTGVRRRHPARSRSTTRRACGPGGRSRSAWIGSSRHRREGRTMWAQLITMRLKPGKDAELATLIDQLRAAEQPNSGLVRSLALRDQKDPQRVSFLVVFESEERARAREDDERRQTGLERGAGDDGRDLRRRAGVRRLRGRGRDRRLRPRRVRARAGSDRSSAHRYRRWPTRARRPGPD